VGDPRRHAAAWAARVAALSPSAAAWATAAAALLVARERFLAGRRLPDPLRRAAAVLLGPAAAEAASLPELARALPGDTDWVLAGVTDAVDLWRAEAGWWRRVEDDGFGLLHHGRFDAAPLVGAAAVLAADAWRIRAALEIAARGGAPLEAFDAVA